MTSRLILIDLHIQSLRLWFHVDNTAEPLSVVCPLCLGILQACMHRHAHSSSIAINILLNRLRNRHGSCIILTQTALDAAFNEDIARRIQSQVRSAVNGVLWLSCTSLVSCKHEDASNVQCCRRTSVKQSKCVIWLASTIFITSFISSFIYLFIYLFKMNKQIISSALQGYEISDFTLTASQPLSINVRTQSAWIHLSRLFPCVTCIVAIWVLSWLHRNRDFFSEKSMANDVTAVKDAFKWMIGYLLPAHLHVRFRVLRGFRWGRKRMHSYKDKIDMY